MLALLIQNESLGKQTSFGDALSESRVYIVTHQPDHSILLWVNKELRWCSKVGGVTGVPVGSATRLHLPDPKSLTKPMGLTQGQSDLQFSWGRKWRYQAMQEYVASLKVIPWGEAWGIHDDFNVVVTYSIFFPSAKWGAIWLGIKKYVV